MAFNYQTLNSNIIAIESDLMLLIIQSVFCSGRIQQYITLKLPLPSLTFLFHHNAPTCLDHGILQTVSSAHTPSNHTNLPKMSRLYECSGFRFL